MIIKCINCDKKFNVNSELIPDQGRTIQCGSCNHIWFFHKKDQLILDNPVIKKDKESSKIQKKDKKKRIIEPKTNYKGTEIIEYKSKSSFSLSNFLSYILVFIISFIAIIIVLDTFKTPLYNIFPKLEFLLFSFFETLKDIKLFVKDLI
tara:strand:+ start:26 stop:472 length:447 start_codon:yes stop_codon:yes gene_type:complete